MSQTDSERLSLLRSEHARLQAAMTALQRSHDVLRAEAKATAGGAEDEESFVRRLVALVASLFEKDAYSDIIIEVDGHTLPGHRLVLAARSSQWGVESLASAQKLTFGNNLSYTTGHTLLRWVYTDELSASLGDSLLLDVMRAARSFSLPALVARCEELLVGRLDVSNCVAVYSAAEELEARKLSSACAALISAHWEELGPADLASMPAQLLYKILRSQLSHPLHAAVGLRREDVLFLYLIEHTASLKDKLNQQDSKGQLPLALALSSGQLGMAATLIAHGAEKDARNAQGEPIFFQAIKDGDSVAAKFLLTEGAATKGCVEKASGRGPLHILCGMEEGRLTTPPQNSPEAPPLQAILELLLARPDVGINAADVEGQTPLHAAVVAGNGAALGLLLGTPGLNLEAAEANGKSALWLALEGEDESLRIARQLREKGADANFRNAKSGDSLAHDAVRRGSVEALCFLVQAKANLNVRSSTGATPLHLASSAEVVGELLKAGAAPNAQMDGGDTALHLAVRRGELALVTALLSAAEVDFGLANDAGRTVLAEALAEGHFPVAEALLKAGAPLESADAEGDTLLVGSIRRGEEDAALWLIKQGANAGAKGGDGARCLSLAVLGAQVAVVSALCGAGADMNVRDADGLPPLWRALESGREDIASVLVQHGCARDGWGPGPSGSRQTLLHRAIDENNEAAACFLVRSICDLDAVRKLGENGEGAEEAAEKATPLHMAAAWGLEEVAGTLAEFGADVNAVDAEGRSPVHVAVINHQEAILKRLLQAPNVALSLRDRRSLTPFAAAMSVQNNKAAQAILERQHTVAHQVDGKGYNFLHQACSKADLESVLFLIGASMDVNIPTADAEASTPLHLAAATGHEMIVRNLLLAGADVQALTRSNQSSLHLAAEGDHAGLTTVLLEAGLSAATVDEQGNTALHVAVQRGSLDTVEVLLRDSDVPAEATNRKGQTCLHLLGILGGENAAEVLEAVLRARPKFPVDAVDAGGNTMLLLAYVNGKAQLCKAAVDHGVCLGTPNAEGVSVFSHETPTKQLLFRLLDQLAQEPRWADGDNCSDCGTKFSLTVRKHHCRHCGRLLCAQCSSSTTPILKYNLHKPVRVCDVCSDVLTLGAQIS